MMPGMTVRYIGSGPYCYANSLAMVLGPAAPSPAVIEVLGWICTRTSAGSEAEAAALLREARESRPLLAGPLEFGLLLYQPGSGTAKTVQSSFTRTWRAITVTR